MTGKSGDEVTAARIALKPIVVVVVSNVATMAIVLEVAESFMRKYT